MALILDSVSLYLDKSYKETMQEYAEMAKDVNSGEMSDSDIIAALVAKGYTEEEAAEKYELMQYISNYNTEFDESHAVDNPGMNEPSTYTGTNILLSEDTAEADVSEDRRQTAVSAESHLNNQTLDSFIRDTVNLCVYTQIDPNSLTMDYTVHTEEFESLIDEFDIDTDDINMSPDRLKMCQILLENGYIPKDEDGINEFFSDFDNNLLSATSQWVEDPSVTHKDILLSNMMLQTHMKAYADHHPEDYLDDLGEFGNIMVNGDTALNILGKDSVYEMLASENGVGVEGKDIHNNGLLVDNINPDCYKYTQSMMATLYNLEGIDAGAVNAMISRDTRSLDSALYSALLFPDSEDEFTTNYTFLRDGFVRGTDDKHPDGLGEPEDYLAEVVDYINETYDEDIDVDEMLQEFTTIHEGGTPDYSLYRYLNNGDTVRDLVTEYPYFEKALMLSVVDECSDYCSEEGIDAYMERQNNMAKQIADATVKDHDFEYDDNNYVGMLFLQDISMHDASALIHNSFDNLDNTSIRYYYDLYPVGNDPTDPDPDPDPDKKIENIYHLQGYADYPVPMLYVKPPKGNPYDRTRTETETVYDATAKIVTYEDETGTKVKVNGEVVYPDGMTHGRIDTYKETETINVETPVYETKEAYDVSGKIIVPQNEDGTKYVVDGQIRFPEQTVHGRIDTQTETQTVEVQTPNYKDVTTYTVNGEIVFPDEEKSYPIQRDVVTQTVTITSGSGSVDENDRDEDRGEDGEGDYETSSETYTRSKYEEYYIDANGNRVVVGSSDWTGDSAPSWDGASESSYTEDTGSSHTETVPGKAAEGFSYSFTDADLNGMSPEAYIEQQNAQRAASAGGSVGSSSTGTSVTQVEDGFTTETYQRSRTVTVEYDQDGNEISRNDGQWTGDSYSDWSGATTSKGEVQSQQTDITIGGADPQDFHYEFDEKDIPEGMDVNEYIAQRNAEYESKYGGNIDGFETDTQTYSAGGDPKEVDFNFQVTDDEAKAAGYASAQDYIDAKIKELEAENGGSVDAGSVNQTKSESQVQTGVETETYTREREVTVEYDQFGNEINRNDGQWTGDDYDGDWSQADHTEGEKTSKETDIPVPGDEPQPFSYEFDMKDVPENMTVDEYIAQRNAEFEGQNGGKIGDYTSETEDYTTKGESKTTDFKLHFSADEMKDAGYTDPDQYIQDKLKEAEQQSGGTAQDLDTRTTTTTTTYVDHYDKDGNLIGTDTESTTKEESGTYEGQLGAADEMATLGAANDLAMNDALEGQENARNYVTQANAELDAALASGDPSAIIEAQAHLAEAQSQLEAAQGTVMELQSAGDEDLMAESEEAPAPAEAEATEAELAGTEVTEAELAGTEATEAELAGTEATEAELAGTEATETEATEAEATETEEIDYSEFAEDESESQPAEESESQPADEAESEDEVEDEPEEDESKEEASENTPSGPY